MFADGCFKEADGEAEVEAALAFVCHRGAYWGGVQLQRVCRGILGMVTRALPAWVGALKAGCDTMELAGIT